MIWTTRFAMAALSVGLATQAPAQDADTIYLGGPILTMDDATPRADALAVLDGRILAVGALDDVHRHRGAATRIVDLDGRALLPGFVDAHGHAMAIGLQALSANLLPAPDGPVNDIASLQQVLGDYAQAHAARIDALGVLIGFGYDDSQLAELRHPTRHDLDAVSADLPIFILHQSGHIAVANTAALGLVGFAADTPEMQGGVIRREADGAPDGVLEETPMFAALTRVLRNLDGAGAAAMFTAGTELLASFGYTTGQDGRSTAGQVAVMQGVAAAQGLAIDVVAYPDVLADRQVIADNATRSYDNRFRVGGAKLTIDGSPQGFTAWRDRPYYRPPDSQRRDYAGYPAASADQVFDAVDWAFANDIQILTHSNGEAASDLLIAAIAEATETHGRADRRPVLIHGQFQRPDQVDSFVALDVFPSLFPMHTFYWGDWHRDRTVGPVNADNISPTGWYLARGARFSTHHDAPVAFPDSMRVLAATVTRRSRSGDIIGPAHRVDVMTALRAMTLWPAYQHFEEDSKGSLVPGKLADLVILSDDPTAVDPETLSTLTVRATIKEGTRIYDADQIRDGSLQRAPTRDRPDPLGTALRQAAIWSELPADLSPLQRRIVAYGAALHGASCVSGFLNRELAALAPD
ncbi:MAG: amidohydrolase [Marinibacterium sp.]|nr:amidohydrolase [Marinibacterium sp.]